MGRHRVNDNGHMRWFDTDEEYFKYIRIRDRFSTAEEYEEYLRKRAYFNSDEEYEEYLKQKAMEEADEQRRKRQREKKIKKIVYISISIIALVGGWGLHIIDGVGQKLWHVWAVCGIIWLVLWFIYLMILEGINRLIAWANGE